VRAGPHRPGPVPVAAHQAQHQRERLLLDARCERLARQGPVVQEAVEVRVGRGEGAVGRQRGVDRGAPRRRRCERCREATQPLLRQQHLDVGTAAQVLVQRRRPHPDPLGERAHGQRVQPLLVDEGHRGHGDAVERGDWTWLTTLAYGRQESANAVSHQAEEHP
jgi:hypothetical protein